MLRRRCYQRMRFDSPRYGVARGRRAFSLVDMTLAVLIMGILAATAAPKLSSSMIWYQVDGAARRIEADINYVRQQARATNSACSLTFAAGGAAYTTTGVLQIDNSGKSYRVDLGALGYPVSVTANINGMTGITYSATGFPQAGSPLVALISGTITITRGTQTRTVIIDPVTGRAQRS